MALSLSAVVLLALVLLALVAAAVTVSDAVRAPHWRGIAFERRQSWLEHAAHNESFPAGR